MSLAWRIEDTIKDLCSKNKIPIKTIKVTPETVEEELRRKRVTIYNVKVIYDTNKPLHDYNVVILNYFIIRFKTFRVHSNFKESSFNFCLKERNLSVLDEIL